MTPAQIHTLLVMHERFTSDGSGKKPGAGSDLLALAGGR